MGVGVESHSTRGQRGLTALHHRSEASQHRLDAAHQLPGRERLGQVVVAPQLQAEHPVDLLGLRRQEDDRDLAPLPQLAADVEPVELRHEHVEHDQIDGRVGVVGVQRGPPVGRLGHVEALPREGVADHLAEPRVVVHHQDARRLHPPNDSPAPSRGAAGGPGPTATAPVLAGRSFQGPPAGATSSPWVRSGRACAQLGRGLCADPVQNVHGEAAAPGG